eukprot:366047-Chlamydomonas_euryale.AAC.2
MLVCYMQLLHATAHTEGPIAAILIFFRALLSSRLTHVEELELVRSPVLCRIVSSGVFQAAAGTTVSVEAQHAAGAGDADVALQRRPKRAGALRLLGNMPTRHLLLPCTGAILSCIWTARG